MISQHTRGPLRVDPQRYTVHYLLRLVRSFRAPAETRKYWYKDRTHPRRDAFPRVLASDERGLRVCRLNLAANMIPCGYGLQR
jgi:hypothetical protein